MKYYNSCQVNALHMLELDATASKQQIQAAIGKRGYLTQRALYSVFRWRR